MFYVKFERQPNGEYTIIDHTGDREYLFGELLLDDDIRNFIKADLEDIPLIKNYKPVTFHTVQHSKVIFERVQDNYLLVKLSNPNRPYNVLETDIPINSLVDLVNDWEDLVFEEAPQIYVMRQRDRDIFIVSEEKLSLRP